MSIASGFLLRCGKFMLPLLLAIVGCLPVSLVAQVGESTVGGREYYLPFPDTAGNLLSKFSPPAVTNTFLVAVYSDTENEVVVWRGLSSTRLVLSPGELRLIDLKSPEFSPPRIAVDLRNTPVSGICRITARDPVVVYCYAYTEFGAEAWTPLPVEAWDRDYLAFSTKSELMYQFVNSKLVPVPAPSQAIVVAAHDNTVVTFALSGSTQLAGPPPGTLILNRGEAYRVEGIVDLFADSLGRLQTDICGLRISADKPVGVLSGNSRAAVLMNNAMGTFGNSFKNLLIEWLSPTSHYGREFVYLPTADGRWSTGGPSDHPGQIREAEIIRFQNPGNEDIRVQSVESGSVVCGTTLDLRQIAPTAAGFRTTAPVQAMMSSSTVVIALSEWPAQRKKETSPTPLWVTRYYGWSPHLVTMVPRELWSNFAPYTAPAQFAAMEQYIDVVTDSANAKSIVDDQGNTFHFNRGAIAGTDLVWGTRQIAPGEARLLRGRNGARFHGIVYGLRKGSSETTNNGGSSGPQIIELQALSYGYPLAFEHHPLGPPDTLYIDSVSRACEFNFTVRSLGENPVGLRSVMLDQRSTNVALDILDPLGGTLGGITRLVGRIHPIDNSLDAHAYLVLTDRTGHATTLPWHYHAARISVNAANHLRFASHQVGTVVDTTLTFTNNGTASVKLEELVLARGDQGFAIVSTNPQLPAVVAPGTSLHAVVRFAPTVWRERSDDTAGLSFGCQTIRVPMVAGSLRPCLEVGDLDFGGKPGGVPGNSTLQLRICNSGDGELRFLNPPLIWDDPHFFLDDSTAGAMLSWVIAPGECREIPVYFRGESSGRYRTTAKVNSTSQCGSDTSVWRGDVYDAVSVPRDADMANDIAIAPNPAGRTVAISITLVRASHVQVDIIDVRGATVASVVDETLPEGVTMRSFNLTSFPAGIYRVVMRGDGLFRSRQLLIVQ